MLNPVVVEHADALTKSLAELRDMGYEGAELDRATADMAYREMSRLLRRYHNVSYTVSVTGLPAEEPETIPTDEIGEPEDE